MDLPPIDFGLSCYHAHNDGSGNGYASHLRPILNMRPRRSLWGWNADTLITGWMEAEGFHHDVLTDHLLHDEGSALLSPYRVLVTGSHPEYWTTAMRQALEEFLAGGGRLMYLGGNGFYWRTAMSPHWPGAVEVRRAEDGTRTWEAEPGEYHHAFTGELGGLWRRIGQSPNALTGVGFAAQGWGTALGYRRNPDADDPRAAFVFEGIDDEIIGDFGRYGGAASEEIDRHDPALGSPAHTLVLATAHGFGPEMLKTKEEFLYNLPYEPDDPDVRADITFFETPSGGGVFSTGSISWAGSLAHKNYDNNVARLTGNVLRRFADPTPFEFPSP